MTVKLDKIDFSKSINEILVSDNNFNFNCYFYSIDQPPPEGVGNIVEFYKIWRRAIQDNVLPSWQDFLIEDFKGWHSNLRLVKCGEKFDKKDEVRIVGETFAQYWGRRSLSEQIREGSDISQTIVNKFHQYLDCLYDGYYAICQGTLPSDGASVRPIWFIDLPLSENRVDISHFLAAICPQEELIRAT